MTVDWQAVRAEFPALARWAFLNTATFGQLPKRSVDAVIRHFEHRDELACADFLDWFDDADRIRSLIARLIHCRAEDIAFVPNAATALSLLIGGLDWRPGNRIVTFQDEFPNNLYHPSLLKRFGVEVVETTWPQFYDAVTPHTRLVVLSEVSYMNGFRPPLLEISQFGVHGYKWLISPNGAGFMYVAPSLREKLEPNIVGWRSHRDWRRVDNLHHGAPEFKSEAEKYEGGMLPFPSLYAMGASVEMMLEIGPEEIEQRVFELAELTRAALRRLGARLAYDESPHFDSGIVAARFERKDASQIARQLKTRNILISARHGNLRISTHFYNNEDDVKRLETELARLA
jgi:cysteine desulfurase/selenocysteine lyase